MKTLMKTSVASYYGFKTPFPSGCQGYERWLRGHTCATTSQQCLFNKTMPPIMTFIIIIRHCNFQTHQISIILIIIIFITHWCQGFHYSPCRKRRTSRLHTFCPGRDVHKDGFNWETFNFLCFLPQRPPICVYFLWKLALVFWELLVGTGIKLDDCHQQGCLIFLAFW